ncbi:MAG: hypothetical protein IJD08_03255, partial [Oscillospiraceae bacterium]|nr:hypothetical protein [Oscillospiraceae bacterium]
FLKAGGPLNCGPLFSLKFNKYFKRPCAAAPKKAPLPKGGWHAHQNKGVTGGFFYNCRLNLTE